MLFSRSEGREVEPPRNTFTKGFGNLYIGTFFCQGTDQTYLTLIINTNLQYSKYTVA